MKKNKILTFIIAIAAVIIGLNIIYFLAGGYSSRGKRSSGNMNLLAGGKVGVIDIVGPLYSSKAICENIRSFNNDSSIKAIVLHIDSPGGGVAVCQEINREIYAARDNGKIVMASFGSIAASGGYYVAAATEEIISNPGTLTGSIGVIISYFNFEELFKKVGIAQVTVKSGKFKDMASMSRKLTTEEESLLQGVIDDVHSQFVDVIARGREKQLKAILKDKKGLADPKEADVRSAIMEIADGRIFSGKQALALGLVDRLGSEEDAIKYAAEAAGIKGEPAVVYPRKKTSILEYLSGSEESDGMMKRFFFKGMCYLYGE